MMSKRVIFYKLMEICLAAAFILTSCNFAAAPVATASATTAPMTSPTPLVPTAMVVVVLSVTATPTQASTPTPAPTEMATSTLQLTPQVNPGMDAYCRKGPGTDYFSITFLQAGNNYNVIGQNGLENWWLVQVPGNVTCWMGDPTTVTQGPVDTVPILPAPPLPSSASSFANTSHCNPVLNTLTVWLTWEAAQGATGYNIYRNGSLIAQLGQKFVSYTDNAPRGVNLKYQIEAINDYGVSSRQTTRVIACT
jgi:hypothetical protein